MRALVVDPQAPAALRLAEVPEPTPAPAQAVIEVHHASINYGELNGARSGQMPPGAVLGWDASGVVVEAAADGSGPPPGARVVAFASAAWAQLATVDANATAVVPTAVDLADAAALPVAGVTALQALRAGGPVLGKRVLVTGASGGVGRYAVQLAALAGATVVASVGSAARGEGLAELGADQVVVGLTGIDQPVDVILDNVGGPQLVEAWGLLAAGGSLQSIGWTAGEPATFPPYATVGAPKSLTSFTVTGNRGADLATLVTLVAEGSLSAEVCWRGSWDRVAEAAQALFGRRLTGKAVLDVG
ncbi:NADPH:quinone reductase [Micromonospora pattaloongensis]|uniref:NADPH:quinone reductase n=1 Tax=Micromonospora pattaloongensis TaxID=405436 RepID=A0A1H3JGH9_9ACTN|nr:zinc-binding dehydrogenase [Micromonospora pattaloongensis]SDY38967.1 NADPH:quinone reductase [Micromonospora pattaloongensis]